MLHIRKPIWILSGCSDAIDYHKNPRGMSLNIFVDNCLEYPSSIYLLTTLAFGWILYPIKKVRNRYVIITSKERFDVIITYLLHSLFAGVRLLLLLQALTFGDGDDGCTGHGGTNNIYKPTAVKTIKGSVEQVSTRCLVLKVHHCNIISFTHALRCYHR